MALTFDRFKEQFNGKVAEYQVQWEVIGFHAPNGSVYPFGTDTKVISTVFETLAAPLIGEIAGEQGYAVESSEQTVYPDFTLTPGTGQPPRIAIDVKTTYRRLNAGGSVSAFRYTLGSYTSFLRSPGAAKNIKYPYEQYADHWVLGFLYTRRAGVAAKVCYKPEEVGQAQCPFTNVEYFIQEKHKIVGLSPASGNTTNIGSFATCDIEDLRAGKGPFALHGKALCDEYWRNYGRTKAERTYGTIEEFIEWRKGQPARC